jgi:hypothetical protein
MGFSERLGGTVELTISICRHAIFTPAPTRSSSKDGLDEKLVV